MATTPMMQAVLLFQHHQTTTPFAPVPHGATRQADEPAAPGKVKEEDMAKPKHEKEDPVEEPPFDPSQEEEEEQEEENEESDETEEANG